MLPCVPFLLYHQSLFCGQLRVAVRTRLYYIFTISSHRHWCNRFRLAGISLHLVLNHAGRLTLGDGTPVHFRPCVGPCAVTAPLHISAFKLVLSQQFRANSRLNQYCQVL